MLDFRTFRPWTGGGRRGARRPAGSAAGSALGLAAVLLLCLADAPLAAEVQAPASPPASAPASAPEPPAEAALLLSSGDKVTVVVFGQTELTGEYVVDAVGDVNLPMVGRIRVAGLSPEQAETLVRTRLNDGYLRSATVSLRLEQHADALHIVGGAPPATTNW